MINGGKAACLIYTFDVLSPIALRFLSPWLPNHPSNNVYSLSNFQEYIFSSVRIAINELSESLP